MWGYVWYQEMVFQVVSFDFPLHKYFLYLVPNPRNPEDITKQEGFFFKAIQS